MFLYISLKKKTHLKKNSPEVIFYAILMKLLLLHSELCVVSYSYTVNSEINAMFLLMRKMRLVGDRNN